MPKKTVTQEIQCLRSMAVSELAERYEAVFGRVPRVKHKDWLWRRIAWKIQEQRFGGLSEVAKRRLDELIAELDLPMVQRTVNGKIARSRPGDPPRGTTLTRIWKGEEVRATAVEGGWECDGVVYRSLSAVAKAVTGSHWNGKLFFGITSRRRAR